MMQCFKCGKIIKSSKCVSCGHDILNTPIVLIWPIEESTINSILVTDSSPNYILCSKTEDERKLSGVNYSEILFDAGLYRGQIKNGNRHGFGIQYNKNNKISYAGNWVEDRKSGYGRIYNQDEQCQFEGFFEDGLRHGKGFDIQINGEFKESKWNKGERVIVDNSSQKQIRSVFSYNPISTNFASKTTNKHNEENVKPHYSILDKKDKELLSKTQKKQIVFSNGKYEGDVKDGLRHGFGIQYDNNGRISYAGMWKNDKKHGKGRIYNQYGKCQFEGSFKSGLRDGEGIEFKENNKVVSSKWLEGVRIG